MANAYLENPLLFLNSTNSTTPSGRNIRPYTRSLAAQQLTRPEAQHGQTSILDFSSAAKSNGLLTKDSRPAKKRRRIADGQLQRSNKQLQVVRTSYPLTISLPGPVDIGWNYTDVLRVASFHVKRTTTRRVLEDPSALGAALRCRQWASISSGITMSPGNACLNSAVVCVATKLRQMFGHAISHPVVLSVYGDALHRLRQALAQPQSYRRSELLTTMQLLAVYEMLGSLDDSAWAKHVRGATTLVQRSFCTTPLDSTVEDELGLTQLVLLLMEVLLMRSLDGSKETPRMPSQHVVLSSDLSLSAAQRERLGNVLEVSDLFNEVEHAMTSDSAMELSERFKLMDQAFLLRDQLRSGVLEDQSKKPEEYRSFDTLAMCLAGEVALNRIIDALRPSSNAILEVTDQKTPELCTQLLQMEFDEAAYPGAELMSAFQL